MELLLREKGFASHDFILDDADTFLWFYATPLIMPQSTKSWMQVCFVFFSIHSYIVVYVIFPISAEGSTETSLWTDAGKLALDIQTLPEVRYSDPQHTDT